MLVWRWSLYRCLLLNMILSCHKQELLKKKDIFKYKYADLQGLKRYKGPYLFVIYTLETLFNLPPPTRLNVRAVPNRFEDENFAL